MTQDQLQALKGTTPFYCVQEVTQATIKAGASNTFFCYDKMEEASKKYDQMSPDIKQLFAGNGQYTTDAVGHWSVYSNVGYSGLISDIYACSGLVSNSSIYSLTNWDSPNFSLQVATQPNFGGNIYIYSQPAYYLITPYYSAKAYNTMCA